MLVHAQRQFLVFANKTMLAVAGACGHVNAYGLLSGCAHAHLSMWVHAYFFSAIFNERWALISFYDIVRSDCHCICAYTLTISPLHTLPYYPQTKHPSCFLSLLKTIGGGLPPSEHGGKTYDWHAAATIFLSSCSSLSALPAKISHLASHPHNTLTRNHTSLSPSPRPHPCTS